MQDKKPKIEFPCQYPIKIIGKSTDNFDLMIIEAINPHLPSRFEGTLETRHSEQGNYTAITIEITATGEQQLKDIFTALKKIESVIMVL